jgi:membrane associated rhomboid family serine protease
VARLFLFACVFFLTVCVLTLGGFAWFIMEPAERTRAEAVALAHLRHVLQWSGRLRFDRDPLAPALRLRTRFAVITAALVAANLAVFVALSLGPDPMSDPAAMLRWGASFGPATSSGQWWRLLTSSFVHASALHLLINLAALTTAGFVLERLLGHISFAAVYAACSVLGAIASLSSSPVSVESGAAPAIFGLYGLLLASWTWGRVQHSTSTIRLGTISRLAPAAALFVAYHSMDSAPSTAASQVALMTGVACGIGLARCAAVRTPRPRSVMATLAITATLAIGAAVPLRGIVDIRPEVERVVALEERLARTYQSAVEGFVGGRVDRKALVEVIERDVLPELEATRRRLVRFTRVPPEHQQMLVATETYLRLRDEGWRMRAAALRQSSSAKLREADKLEHASLVAFAAIPRGT